MQVSFLHSMNLVDNHGQILPEMIPKLLWKFLLQPLWNNRFLSVKFPSGFISLMVKHKLLL